MAQKAVIDTNLEKLLNTFADNKRQAGTKLKINEVVPWFRPASSTSGLQTEAELIAISDLFNTDEAEEALQQAYKPGSPGNNGDNVVLPLQIDYAAQAERAYRARHAQGFPRSIAHLAAKSKGHGNPDTGVFLGQVLGYIKEVMKLAATSSDIV